MIDDLTVQLNLRQAYGPLLATLGSTYAAIVPEVEAVWILASLRGIMGQWLYDESKTPLAEVRDAFVTSVRKALQT